MTTTAPPDAAAATTNDAGAEPAGVDRGVTAFYPTVEGVCPAARTTTIGTHPVLVFPRHAWAMHAEGPKLLYAMPEATYDAFVGAMTGGSERIGDIGGTDEGHVWVIVGSHSGRGIDTSYVQFNGKVLQTPSAGQSWFAVTRVIPQPDGSIWGYGDHNPYYGAPGDPPPPGPGESWQKLNRYFAWSADGAPIKPNLPGPDMEHASRMESGEIVAPGLSTHGRAMLRRWSPTRKVSDLVVPDSVVLTDPPELALGTKRAVLRSAKNKAVFYSYDGADKLVAAPINGRLKTASSWLLSTADQLMVTTSDGTLLIEAADGSITEEKLPEPARLAPEPGATWLMADSGAVYTRAGTEWRKLTLGAGPWAAETRPPARVEWVRTLGGETWVSTVRTDAGFGQKRPAEVRTFYASKPRTTPLRCGSPYPNGEVASFPPKADASCKDLVVVIGRESVKEEKPSYPKLAAVLKDEATLGETLAFVDFAGTSRLFGVLAPTPEIAAALAKKLAKVTAHEPEIVCGASDVQRKLTLQVKTGTFVK